MGCGGSVGEGYGPMIVSSRKMEIGDLDRIKIAVPGELTTAFLALKIFNPNIKTETVPFDKIIPAIQAGTYDAGLIIHEGQLTYGTSGLNKILDLGVWWQETTGLVLPLGGNAIRRSLGAEQHKIISKALRDSIQHALDHREQALEYAMQFARDLDTRMASRFVSMYVNERTLDYGEDGRDAIRKLLALGHERGIIPIAPQVDFVD
jgi:1,4-dihydroxy-6-naphthoate synthase